MPNIVKILLGALVITIIVFLYLYRFSYYPNQTPLIQVGYTYHKSTENIVIHLLNKGIANVTIKSVIVNNNEKPRNFSLLNVVKQNYLLGGPIEGNHEDYLIPHSKNLENRNMGIYIQYGLYISNDTPIKNVEIEYYYLGIMYKLFVELNTIGS